MNTPLWTGKYIYIKVSKKYKTKTKNYKKKDEDSLLLSADCYFIFKF